MKPKVSIVIPVYNAEMYLNQCIESCLNQSFKEIEVILVDDGSTDHSGEICDLYGKRDHRITVIHKKNEGVGLARNCGLKKSKGEYMYFADADDWLNPELISESLKSSYHQQIDIIQFGFNKVDFLGNIISKFTPPAISVNNLKNERYKLITILETGTGLAVWDKLIKTEIIKNHGLLFDNKKRGQDFTFVIDCLDKALSFKSINKPFYNYRVIYGSQNKFDYNIIENHLENYRKIISLFGINAFSDLRTKTYLLKLAIMWFVFVIPLNICNTQNLIRKEKMNLLKELVKIKELKGWLLTPPVTGLGMKNTILLWIYKIGNPKLLYFSTKLMAFFRKIFKLSK